MAKTLYRIKDHDAMSVTLKDPMSVRTVRIARAQIASLSMGRGELSITTTGGDHYRVTRGLLPKQRALTRAAFTR